MTTTLLLCETCGSDAAAPCAVRKGELFAAEVEGLLQEQLAAGAPPLTIKRTRCLMACQRHCTALLQATTEGRGLYERLGFVRTGEIRQHQGVAQPAPLIALPEERWRPSLEPWLLAFGQEVEHWFIGRVPDTTAFGSSMYAASFSRVQTIPEDFMASEY